MPPVRTTLATPTGTRCRAVGRWGLLAAGVCTVLVSACAPLAESQRRETPASPQPVPVRPAPDRAPVEPPVGSAPDSARSTYISDAPRPGIGGCDLFPDDHFSRAEVDTLGVRADSARIIDVAGPDRSVTPGFGSTIWEGSMRGFPFNVVDSRTAPVQNFLIAGDYVATSETAMPWPAEPRFEGWPGRAWDRHILVVDSATCRSWEGINLQPPTENIWAALAGAWWADKVVSIELGSNTPRRGGTVIAAGNSMLAGLVRYDEVAAGEINHVLTMSLPIIRSGVVRWPAFGTDGRSDHPDAPPMGTWFRLRSDADLSGLGPQARVVAKAMQRHGLVVSDTGPGVGIAGEPDLRWSETDLSGLRRFTLSDLEAIDPSPMMVSADSMAIR